MASIDTALFTRMSTFAALTALVSTRIYPVTMPQAATFPCVTYQQISGVRDYVMGNQSGLVRARFQVDSWSETYAETRSVSEQVRLALSNYAGTSDTVVIDRIEMVNEERLDESESALHRIMQEYMVTFRETLPS
jgi:hypothetical protein